MTLTGDIALCHSAGAIVYLLKKVHHEENLSRKIQIRFTLQYLVHCNILVNSSNNIISATVRVGFMMVEILGVTMLRNERSFLRSLHLFSSSLKELEHIILNSAGQRAPHPMQPIYPREGSEKGTGSK